MRAILNAWAVTLLQLAAAVSQTSAIEPPKMTAAQILSEEVEYFEYVKINDEWKELRPSRKTVKYDDQGRQVEWTAIAENGEVEQTVQNKYDNQGRSIETVGLNASGAILYRCESRYEGDLLKEGAVFGHGGQLQYRTVHSANEFKTVSRTRILGPDGSPLEREEEILPPAWYRETVNLRVKYVEVMVLSDSPLCSETIYLDRSARMQARVLRIRNEHDRVREEVFYDQAMNLVLWKKYSFDDNGRQTEKTETDGKGKLIYRCVVEFDPRGEIARELDFQLKGEDLVLHADTRHEYSYDDHGRWIIHTVKVVKNGRLEPRCGFRRVLKYRE